jgi:hypothetical protein
MHFECVRVRLPSIGKFGLSCVFLIIYDTSMFKSTLISSFSHSAGMISLRLVCHSVK